MFAIPEECALGLAAAHNSEFSPSIVRFTSRPSSCAQMPPRSLLPVHLRLHPVAYYAKAFSQKMRRDRYSRKTDAAQANNSNPPALCKWKLSDAMKSTGLCGDLRMRYRMHRSAPCAWVVLNQSIPLLERAATIWIFPASTRSIITAWRNGTLRSGFSQRRPVSHFSQYRASRLRITRRSSCRQISFASLARRDIHERIAPVY